MDLEIWVVFPDRRLSTSAVRGRLRKECRKRGWRIQEKRSHVQNIRGRPVQLVGGADAVELYRRAHEVKVAVLFFGKPRVPLSPHAEASRPGETVTLARFVRYKAHAQRVPAEVVDISTYCETCALWHREVNCENGHDPRCLPFHLFQSDLTELARQEERWRFDEVHGAGGRRQDGRGLAWELGTFYGKDRLHVAGRELPAGFHWDVSTSRGAKTITTPGERWKVSVYVNIAPNGHVRGRSPYARKIRE